MSSSESEKGLGSTDPNRAFLPPGGAAGAPTAAEGWPGCSPEISQLSFGRTFEQGNGARDPAASVGSRPGGGVRVGLYQK